MPFRLHLLAGLLCACAAISALTAGAVAAPPPVMAPDGTTSAQEDPVDPATAAVVDPMALAPEPLRRTRAQGRRRPAAPVPRRGPRASAAASERAVPDALRDLLAAGAIDVEEHDARVAVFEQTRATAARLEGRRKLELGSVVTQVEELAAADGLTATRLHPLWSTLERNAQWWSNSPLPTAGQRVSFPGSELLWQYVPGSGLQLHPLANFGRLNGLWQGGRRYQVRMEALMDELLALAVERGDGLAWEYYFDFGPSPAPWVSGMAQATGLQALVRAATRSDRREEVLPIAARGLGIFESAPPVGVRVASGDGAHYLLYSGDPELRVLNGFMQALVGLHDFGTLAEDPRALRLYAEGEAAAAREIAAADTGAWSLYALGRVSEEATLPYHRLVIGFFGNLCTRTRQAFYCGAQQRFGAYLTQAPKLSVAVQRGYAGRSRNLRLRLSKRAAVSVQVKRGETVVAARSLGPLAYGRRSFAFTPPPSRRSAVYTVTYTAVDVAGNRGSAQTRYEVRPTPRKARRQPSPSPSSSS